MAQREERLSYALANNNRDWTNVVFSGEKIFQIDLHQKTHLDRPKNANYIQPTRSERISCSALGWICRGGPGEMAIVSGRLNSVEYVKIFEDVLVPSLMGYGDLPDFVFMQDTRTALMTGGLVPKNPNVEFINAPTNSPDLNPIESFWAEMTRDWVSFFPRNVATLESYVVERWENWRGQSQYFENLYGSMPHRINAVIDNNGGPTRY